MSVSLFPRSFHVLLLLLLYLLLYLLMQRIRSCRFISDGGLAILLSSPFHTKFCLCELNSNTV